jgi:hypothetical protein
MNGSRKTFGIHIAAMGFDGGHTGAHWTMANIQGSRISLDKGGMPNLYAWNVGDRIQDTRWQQR